jgi:hypothetical protein
MMPAAKKPKLQDACARFMINAQNILALQQGARLQVLEMSKEAI